MDLRYIDVAESGLIFSVNAYPMINNGCSNYLHIYNRNFFMEESTPELRSSSGLTFGFGRP